MTEAARLASIAEPIADTADDFEAGHAADRASGAGGRADGVTVAHSAADESELCGRDEPPADPEAERNAAEREVESYFGLRRNDQLAAAALISAILVFSGMHWGLLSGWGLEPIEIERLPERKYAFRLDINTATWVEWMQLPEIGETLARRIVADREERGPFVDIEDLQRVRGIGPKTIERIQPWLREGAGAELSDDQD